uniref:Uncharacterized protein AlNc14C21G2184 n=1 Tax=Albugo laibachii Nc14 TaxID=890382 RepID=F0W5L9_9STRA|nr:conserved hypothetical protein [Albugo laibachii Nc14]|eukprot:CCA16410.1 conserved hypothetical protein [Albugo laibachii Nc14]
MTRTSAQSDEQKRRLPSRNSRGVRISKLIGEEAEADVSFWDQDVWDDDAEDDDYNSEAEEEDVIDSDFDEDEAPDDDVHDEDADRRPQKTVKKKNVFKDKIAQVASAKSLKRLRKQDEEDAIAQSTDTKDQQTFEYVAPEVRVSITRKINEFVQSRKEILDDEAYEESQEKRSKKPKAVVRLSQTQLLNEAVQTELENTQSLNLLERLEEEKKMEIVVPKVPFAGKIVRYRSRIGAPNTITFLNTHEYPAIFNQRKPRKRIAHRNERTRYLTKEVLAEPVAIVENEASFPKTSMAPDVSVESAICA